MSSKALLECREVEKELAIKQILDFEEIEEVSLTEFEKVDFMKKIIESQQT